MGKFYAPLLLFVLILSSGFAQTDIAGAGQLIFKVAILSPYEESQNLNLSHLSDGVYFTGITTGKGRIVRKLVIAH